MQKRHMSIDILESNVFVKVYIALFFVLIWFCCDTILTLINLLNKICLYVSFTFYIAHTK